MESEPTLQSFILTCFIHALVCCWRNDLVAQHAQPGDFQFHHVAELQEPADLQRTTASDRPRTEELPGADRLVARNVRQNILELVVHLAAIAA